MSSLHCQNATTTLSLLALERSLAVRNAGAAQAELDRIARFVFARRVCVSARGESARGESARGESDKLAQRKNARAYAADTRSKLVIQRTAR